MSPSFVRNFSSFPLLEGDRDPSHLHPLPPTTNSSLPYSFFFNNPRDQGAITSDLGHRHHQELQPQELDEHFLVGAPRDQLSFPCYNNNHHHRENYDNKTVQQLCAQHVGEDGQHGTAKPMVSKVRLMRKMMDAHQTVENKPRKNMQVIQGQNHRNQESSSNKSNKNNDNGSPSGAIRVCSDCNTTKTPLWRSGPRGPKSLCNACGIRQRKTRRAMEAAAVSGGLISTDTPTKAQKEKISDVYLTLPLKKRCKITTTGTSTAPKKLCFDDIMINLSNNSTFHRIFPQDERDAAILLMALSCGIIRS